MKKHLVLSLEEVEEDEEKEVVDTEVEATRILIEGIIVGDTEEREEEDILNRVREEKHIIRGKTIMRNP